MARPKAFDPTLALDRAIEVFWRQGFEATPVSELCQAMRLNPGSLYGTFGSKRALFMKALRHYVDTASFAATQQIVSHPSGLGGIKGYFACVVDAIVDGKLRWGCLLTNSLVELSARDPEIVAIVEVHLQQLEAAFGAALARARASGEIEAAAGDGLATYLVCVVQGLNVLATTRPSRATLESVVDAALRALGPLPASARNGRGTSGRAPALSGH